MNLKKRGKWIGLAALTLLIAVCAICLTDGKPDSAKKTEKSPAPEEGSKNTDETLGKDIIIAENEVNGYQLRLTAEYTEIVKDELSPYHDMYEGMFTLETYKNDVKCDKFPVQFLESDDTQYFPKDLTLPARDYDGDGKKNDFTLGQAISSSSTAYQFYNVDEAGTISQLILSTDTQTYLVADYRDYSHEFARKGSEIEYTAYNQKTGKQEKKLASVIKRTALNKIPTSDTLEYRILSAIQDTAPRMVSEELQSGVLDKIYGKDSNDISYLFANAEQFDDVTLRLDFSFQNSRLMQYVSKAYGFVDHMPKDRITKRQALCLVQKFAAAFQTTDNATAEIRQTKPPKNADNNCVYFEDSSGASYTVRLDRNMVVRYETA